MHVALCLLPSDRNALRRETTRSLHFACHNGNHGDGGLLRCLLRSCSQLFSGVCRAADPYFREFSIISPRTQPAC
eukprot:scaffold7639_cov83-Skeletonema_dohrnii-CCMP3373.AAC.2